MSAFATRLTSRGRDTTFIASLAIVVALSIAGCGSGSTPAPAATGAAPTAAASAASAAPVAGSPVAGGDDSCGAKTAALLRTILTQPGIISITNEGGCKDATIVTSLTDEAAGLAICRAAEAVAYKAGDIFSITVTGANDVELSGGDADVPCIGEH
jgi:hypothetical protein